MFFLALLLIPFSLSGMDNSRQVLARLRQNGQIKPNTSERQALVALHLNAVKKIEDIDYIENALGDRQIPCSAD